MKASNFRFRAVVKWVYIEISPSKLNVISNPQKSVGVEQQGARAGEEGGQEGRSAGGAPDPLSCSCSCPGCQEAVLPSDQEATSGEQQGGAAPAATEGVT